MSHLLALSVGPVQEFIAAARRTRDLWFGSRLLSEISREVATSVQKQGGRLIFPASITDEPDENIANIILVELPGGDPAMAAKAAKDAALARWHSYTDEARAIVTTVIRSEIWKDQADDVIEFYAAWVRLDDDYSAARRQVMRLLAGRKNCRDFTPATNLDIGLPKSSLDGQRATVLVGPRSGESQATYRNRWRKEVRRRLRVRSGEQLDVVGVVKRVGDEHRPFPSVSRIAADLWLRGIANRGGEAVLSEFVSQCNTISRDILHRLEPEVFPQYRLFPFEGTAVYRSRHHEWWEETEDAPDREQDRRKPEWYEAYDRQLKRVEQFARSHGVGEEPNPYLAVIVADGDSMGAAIRALTSADDNQAFSRVLAGFAGEAKKIIEGHNGVLVYAGGDDVLAFVPVDKSLKCARKLHDVFASTLKSCEKLDKVPTLSVGIAIGHFMENLEDLLAYGRAAEKAAKKVPGKDALAVHLHKRGGAPIQVTGKWSDDIDGRLKHFADLLNQGVIPSRLPYELRTMAHVYAGWKMNADAAIQCDLVRLIAKKQSRDEQTVKAALDDYIKDMDSAKLLSFAQELLVARQIATALRQAGGDS